MEQRKEIVQSLEQKLNSGLKLKFQFKVSDKDTIKTSIDVIPVFLLIIFIFAYRETNFKISLSISTCCFICIYEFAKVFFQKYRGHTFRRQKPYKSQYVIKNCDKKLKGTVNET